jgi:hypothetical protein
VNSNSSNKLRSDGARDPDTDRPPARRPGPRRRCPGSPRGQARSQGITGDVPLRRDRVRGRRLRRSAGNEFARGRLARTPAPASHQARAARSSPIASRSDRSNSPRRAARRPHRPRSRIKPTPHESRTEAPWESRSQTRSKQARTSTRRDFAQLRQRQYRAQPPHFHSAEDIPQRSSHSSPRAPEVRSWFGSL